MVSGAVAVLRQPVHRAVIFKSVVFIPMMSMYLNQGFMKTVGLPEFPVSLGLAQAGGRRLHLPSSACWPRWVQVYPERVKESSFLSRMELGPRRFRFLIHRNPVGVQFFEFAAFGAFVGNAVVGGGVGVQRHGVRVDVQDVVGRDAGAVLQGFYP